MSRAILKFAQVRLLILWNSERKRDSNDIFELPESKKLRLSEDTTIGQKELSIPVVADMELDAKSGSARKGKDNAQSQNGGGSFKENPYTFLAPNDPILLTCM